MEYMVGSLYYSYPNNHCWIDENSSKCWHYDYNSNRYSQYNILIKGKLLFKQPIVFFLIIITVTNCLIIKIFVS